MKHSSITLVTACSVFCLLLLLQLGSSSLAQARLKVTTESTNTTNTVATDTAEETTNTVIQDTYTFEEPAVTGTTFYIDPVNGSSKGDGSKANPWLSLQQVIEDGLIQYYAPVTPGDTELELVNEEAPVKGGDRLLLKSGYHGYVNLHAFAFNNWLTIAAAEGETPILSQFKLIGVFKKIYLKNLTIIKDSYQGAENFWEAEAITQSNNAGLYLASNNYWGTGSEVIAYGLQVKTTEDASGWTAGDWCKKAANGIFLRSVLDCSIINCRMENVRHGLSIEYNSDNTIAVGNTVKYFSGDGCRLISNNVYLAYNTITDCLKVDGNHDDGIQSYTRGENGSTGTGVLSNNVLLGNLIIGTTDFSHPLASSPQGIGCFDGMFDNWRVENNVVIVDHYHGISFYGLRNSTIANNTVIDQRLTDKSNPWIKVTAHKNGTPSSNCVVANNLVYRSVSASGTKVTATNNYVVGRNNASLLSDLFVDSDNLDFHLKTSALTQEAIIDQGRVLSGSTATEIDRDGINRTGMPDIGAYEVR